MTSSQRPQSNTLAHDLPAGLVTFLVALPLCLGIALASNAPLFSGIVAGIVGGIVVGALSGSNTSVAGPAAGLTAIVSAQIATLGSFSALLAATMLAGFIQIAMGLARAGSLASFVPGSVVKGLLAAIGCILVLKQTPHAIGHDPDPIGDMAFDQPDHENTFTELVGAVVDVHPSALVIGLGSLLVLGLWGNFALTRNSRLPAPLVVAVLGVGLNLILATLGPAWILGTDHLVSVPVIEDLDAFRAAVQSPDFSQWMRPALWEAALTLALVASLETLINLDAADSLDPQQRHSPPSRELVAQGVGNVCSGLLGGLPLTSVVVRSSVNVAAGSKSKLSTIIHGALLMACVFLVPHVLNLIPLASLAAILIVTGLKLASPALFARMWREGAAQFAPFIVTVVGIVFMDLLKGVVAGLLVSLGFILHSNLRRPVKRIIEQHLTGEILRIELGEQVSFLNRAALEVALNEIQAGRHVLLDARSSRYIDPDILDLVHDFIHQKAGPRGITVSSVGFKDRYSHVITDNVQFVDYSTQELQSALTPTAVLRLLMEGNVRFRTGQRLTRDLRQQVMDTAAGQAPLAVVLACIDSRSPSELIFDLGIGDVFSVRLAGNVAGEKVLGSMEFGCAIAGAKLIMVLGHTHCGAVKAAVDSYGKPQKVGQATGCCHLDVLVDDIHQSIRPGDAIPDSKDEEAYAHYTSLVALRHVQRTIQSIRAKSPILDRLVREDRLAIVGGLYDVRTGLVELCEADGPLSRSLIQEEPVAALEPVPVAG